MVGLIASCILGLLGGFFLLRGKKIQSVGMMLLGAALIVASYVMFG